MPVIGAGHTPARFRGGMPGLACGGVPEFDFARPLLPIHSSASEKPAVPREFHDTDRERMATEHHLLVASGDIVESHGFGRWGGQTFCIWREERLCVTAEAFFFLKPGVLLAGRRIPELDDVIIPACRHAPLAVRRKLVVAERDVRQHGMHPASAHIPQANRTPQRSLARI